jgi:hypothetical protein
VVLHIYNTSKEFFKGTIFEDDWYFYHDTLSLMCHADNRRWMAEQGILKHWILPPKGLNDEFKHYKFVPVGASHELMPLDSHLNNDVHQGVRRHCMATRNLKTGNKLKFDMSTPKRGVSAYLRVWDPKHGPTKGCPNQERIIQDIYRICHAEDTILMEIWAARGIALEEHGAGHGRRVRKGSGSGGRRTKLRYCERTGLWLHDHAAKEVAKRDLKNKKTLLFTLYE